jgi:hypothetical protein
MNIKFKNYLCAVVYQKIVFMLQNFDELTMSTETESEEVHLARYCQAFRVLDTSVFYFLQLFQEQRRKIEILACSSY